MYIMVSFEAQTVTGYIYLFFLLLVHLFQQIVIRTEDPEDSLRCLRRLRKIACDVCVTECNIRLKHLYGNCMLCLEWMGLWQILFLEGSTAVSTVKSNVKIYIVGQMNTGIFLYRPTLALINTGKTLTVKSSQFCQSLCYRNYPGVTHIIGSHSVFHNQMTKLYV